MDEFTFIETVLAPLASETPGALGLRDDAARVALAGPGCVVSTDTLIEGVHFLATDPLDSVGAKALRVNLSDLAAKGAQPRAYLLNLSWPHDRPLEDARALVAGLARDQERYCVGLLGGDTTRTPGPLTLTITAFGEAARFVPRSGAQAGDQVWVTGTLGDAGLGLSLARDPGHAPGTVSPDQRRDLIARYRSPEPRTEVARLLGAHASAAADISDGLIADLGHILRASNARRPAAPLHAILNLVDTPVSRAAVAWRAALKRPERLAFTVNCLTAGDDYEIVFTAPPARSPALSLGFKTLGLRLTCLGHVSASPPATAQPIVRVRDEEGAFVQIAQTGYTHF